MRLWKSCLRVPRRDILELARIHEVKICSDHIPFSPRFPKTFCQHSETHRRRQKRNKNLLQRVKSLLVGAFVLCGICYGDRNYNKIQCFSPHLNGTFVMFMTGEEEQPDEIQLNWRSEELNREVSISDDSYRARRNQLSRYHATLPFQISSQQSKPSVPCATFNF